MAEVEVAEKFKILSHGTHSSNGSSLIQDRQDQIFNPPAEPAIIEEKLDQETDPPAEPAKNEAVLTKTPPSEPEAKQEPVPPKNWEDSLKEQGFDEKFINVAKHFKDKGDLKPYVEALSTDVSKMSPEQILKYNLQKTYSQATPEELELLYEVEVRDKYKLDEEKYLPETVEAKAGKAKMRMDVESLRTKIAEDLSKYTLPTFDRQAEEARQQEAIRIQHQANIDSFYNDDNVKSFAKDKKIVIGNLGTGVPDFNMVVEDPSEITGMLTDPAKGARAITDEKGNVNRKAQVLIGTFASNPSGFCQALINYGKSLGKEELIEEKSNPPKKTGSPATPSRESLKEAFISRGVNGRG